MAFLDSTIYDLTTDQGQQDAVSDLIDEMNSAYQDSERLNYLNIAAYGEISIDVDLSVSRNYLASYKHGLGYKPAFLAYWSDDSDPSNILHQNLPVDGFFDTGLTNGFTQNAYCDETNIYIQEIYGPDFGFDPEINKYIFYIFNLPMPT